MSELREKERSMAYMPVVFDPLLFPHGFLDGLLVYLFNWV